MVEGADTDEESVKRIRVITTDSIPVLRESKLPASSQVHQVGPPGKSINDSYMLFHSSPWVAAKNKNV